MTGGLHLSRVSLSLSHSLSLFRGQSFRKEFSHLGEISSIIPLNVHVMALTATATLSTRHYIMDTLSMKTENTHIVYVPPVKDNNPTEAIPSNTCFRTASSSIQMSWDTMDSGGISSKDEICNNDITVERT